MEGGEYASHTAHYDEQYYYVYYDDVDHAGSEDVNGTALDDYYPDYTSASSSDNVFLDEVVPSGIVYALTLVLGLVGNILVIFCVTRYKRLRNVTNVFLISLACADLLLVLICVPVKFAIFMSHTWELGLFACKFVHYMQLVSMICSVLTLTGMSLERYYAILWPIQAKYMCTMTHARVVVVCIWCVSFVLGVPILIGQNIKEVKAFHSDRVARWCKKIWSSQEWSIVFESYLFVVLYVIPLGVMTFAYANICRELFHMTWRRASLRAPTSSQNGCNGRASEDNTDLENGHTGGSSFNAHVSGRPLMMRRQSNKDDVKTRKSVIKMLVAVILIYAVCWGPFLLNNLLVATKTINELNMGYLKPMRMAFYLMAYFNSCVNPIVYGFMSKNFRESFKKSLNCWSYFKTKTVRQQHLSVRTTSSVTRQMSLKTNIDQDKMNRKVTINDDINRTPDTSMVDEAL